MTDTYAAADTDPSSVDDGSEDWAETSPAYAIDPPDSTADDGSDDWPETPSTYPPGALSYPDAPDPTASPTRNPWIMPQVGILDPDAEAQLSAFQNRMNGVQQLLSQLYPMTNGPSTLTGDPTTDLINDPLYHDPSDYDEDGVFYADPNYGGASSVPPSTVDPYQPGVVTTDGRLIPDPVGDPAAPSGFGGGFSPSPAFAISDPNTAQVVAPSPLFQGADIASIQPISTPELGGLSGSLADDGADGDASADDPDGYRYVIDPRQTGGAAGPVSWSPDGLPGSDPSTDPAAAWTRPPMPVPSPPPSPNLQAAAQKELSQSGTGLDSSTNAFNDAMATLAQGLPLLASQKTPEVRAWLEAHPDLTYQPGDPLWFNKIQAQNLAIDRALLKRPEVRAMLDTIAFTEGYFNGKPVQYDSMFGDGVGGAVWKFHDFSKHPGRVGASYRDDPQSAAGRYQIEESKYGDLVKEIGLNNMTPATQDVMAVQIMRKYGILGPLLNGDLKGAISAAGTSRQWTSMPKWDPNVGGTGGWVRSDPRQAIAPYPAIEAEYYRNLDRQKRGAQ